jgi:hypothetical protein
MWRLYRECPRNDLQYCVHSTCSIVFNNPQQTGNGNSPYAKVALGLCSICIKLRDNKTDKCSLGFSLSLFAQVLTCACFCGF